MAALIPRLPILVLPLALAALLVLASCDGKAPVPGSSAVGTSVAEASPAALVVDPSALLEAARAAADFLLYHQGSDGSLAFRSQPGVDGLQRRDNDLHQAGACLALLEVYRHTGEARFRKGAEAGLSLLLEQTRGPRPEDAEAGFRAVVFAGVGTVGASALTLLALLEHRAATGSEDWSEAMAGLALFLAFQEGVDGEILPRYLYDDAQAGPFEIPYASSTATLALVRYARISPQGVLSSWFNDAERGAGWLMAVRDLGRTYDELPHDSRLLQTLDELHELSGGGRTYYLHARRVAQGILEAREEETVKPCSPGTMMRAAGMASVVRIARRARVSAAVYEAALEEMVEDLLRCQVTERSVTDLPHLERTLGAMLRDSGSGLPSGWDLPVRKLRSDDAADAASVFIAARQVLNLATPGAPG